MGEPALGVASTTGGGAGAGSIGTVATGLAGEATSLGEPGVGVASTAGAAGAVVAGGAVVVGAWAEPDAAPTPFTVTARASPAAVVVGSTTGADSRPTLPASFRRTTSSGDDVADVLVPANTKPPMPMPVSVPAAAAIFQLKRWLFMVCSSMSDGWVGTGGSVSWRSSCARAVGRR